MQIDCLITAGEGKISCVFEGHAELWNMYISAGVPFGIDSLYIGMDDVRELRAWCDAVLRYAGEG